MTEETTMHSIREVPTATAARQDRSFLRSAGWSGVIGTLAFIVTVAMTSGGVAAPEGAEDMLRFLDDVSDGGAMEYLYGVAGVVLVVLYIPMAIGVYWLLGKSTVAWYGSAAVVFGLVVLLPAYLINLLPPFALVPLVAELGGVGGEVLYADYSVARSAAELCFTVGSLLSLGFGPLLWGYEWLRSLDSRRWLGWMGVITGLTGMIWFVWLINSSLVGIVLIANVVLSLVFFAGASIVLVSEGRSGS